MQSKVKEMMPYLTDKITTKNMDKTIFMFLDWELEQYNQTETELISLYMWERLTEWAELEPKEAYFFFQEAIRKVYETGHITLGRNLQ